MQRILRVLCLCMMAILPLSAAAEEPADSIQGVISDQLSAFQANDVDRAFSHASPSIQQKFGTASQFGRMVEYSYPMVWRPQRFEMRDLIETGAGLVQVVLFEDRAGALHEAGYLMQEVDGVWRINGVKLRALPGVAS